MGRPRKKPWERKIPQFEPGQLVEPTVDYVMDLDGTMYVGHPGVTRLDGGDPQVQAQPQLHKLIDPDAYKDG